MKCEKINDDLYKLSLSKEEINGIAKSIFYIQELKKNQILFEGLIKFLLDIRNSFLQFAD